MSAAAEPTEEAAPGAVSLGAALLFGALSGALVFAFASGDVAQKTLAALMPTIIGALLGRGLSGLGRAKGERAREVEQIVQADRAARQAAGASLDAVYGQARPGGLVRRHVQTVRAYVRSASLSLDVRLMEEETTDALSAQGDVARQIASLSVLLGLLGTLAGLTVAVVSLRSVGAFKTAQDVPRFLEAAGRTLEGFGTAFVSAGFGVLVSVVLTAAANRHDRAVSGVARLLMRLTVDWIVPAAEAEARVASPGVVMGAIREMTQALALQMPSLIGKLTEATESVAQGVERLEQGAEKNAETSAALKDATAEMRHANDQMREKMQSLGGVADSIRAFQEDFEQKGGKVFDHIVDGSKELAGGFSRLDRTLQEGAAGTQREIREAATVQVQLVQGLLEEVERHRKVAEALETLVAGIPTVTVVGGTAEAAAIRAAVEDSNRRTADAIARLSERVDALGEVARRAAVPPRPYAPLPPQPPVEPPGTGGRLREWLQETLARFRRE